MVSLAYVIGRAEPTMVDVNTFGTGKVNDREIVRAVTKTFDLTPRGIIEKLDLLRPIYLKTAAYGHFGRELPEFAWEHADMASQLLKEV